MGQLRLRGIGVQALRDRSLPLPRRLVRALAQDNTQPVPKTSPPLLSAELLHVLPCAPRTLRGGSPGTCNENAEVLSRGGVIGVAVGCSAGALLLALCVYAACRRGRGAVRRIPRRSSAVKPVIGTDPLSLDRFFIQPSELHVFGSVHPAGTLEGNGGSVVTTVSGPRLQILDDSTNHGAAVSGEFDAVMVEYHGTRVTVVAVGRAGGRGGVSARVGPGHLSTIPLPPPRRCNSSLRQTNRDTRETRDTRDTRETRDTRDTMESRESDQRDGRDGPLQSNTQSHPQAHQPPNAPLARRSSSAAVLVSPTQQPPNRSAPGRRLSRSSFSSVSRPAASSRRDTDHGESSVAGGSAAAAAPQRQNSRLSMSRGRQPRSSFARERRQSHSAAVGDNADGPMNTTGGSSGHSGPLERWLQSLEAAEHFNWAKTNLQEICELKHSNIVRARGPELPTALAAPRIPPPLRASQLTLR